MSLIVETGAHLPNAESYASVADADLHHGNRGRAAWDALSVPAKEQALRNATDYMQQTYRTRWAGYRVDSRQALDWPRFDARKPDAVSPDGYGAVALYAQDEVPTEVRTACMELALRASAAELLSDLAPGVASESVGPISTSYFQGARRTITYPTIDRLLAPLLTSGAGFRLVRA